MCGVAVDTLRDMEVLFDGIPLDQVTTSMTINGPAIVLLAFYVALADKRGIPRDRIGGTVQNDCLKEFIAQHAWLVPPRPGDAHRHRHDRVLHRARCPRWNTVSISGYHIREAGATAAQELAFTLADGIALRAELPSSAGSTSTHSRRGSPSSSTCTTTSSRRSPSSAPRAACGRAS